MEKKEKQENAGAQKPVEKNMKLYLVCSFVFGLLLAFIIANLIVECEDRRTINNTVRYANVERAMNDVMREKEIVDNKLEDSIFVAKIRKGKVHLGGCTITTGSPMYHCNACGFDWGDSYE